MFARFSTLLVVTSRTLSRALGNQLAVIITPHKIQLEMIDPDDTNRDWDESLYTYGNIYFRNFANPIKLQVPDSENDAEESMGLEMIASDRYKDVMDQNLISDIINEGKDDVLDLYTVALILGGLQVITLLTLLWMVLG